MKSIIYLPLVAAFVSATVTGQPQAPARISGSSPRLLRTSLDKIPLHIVENRGVFPDAVRFYIQGKDKTIFFTADGITFVLRGEEQDWAVKVDFVNASTRVRLRGEQRRRAVFSYFRGPRDSWKTGLPSFGQVVYEDLWPGIDLVYSAGVGALKYAFVVRPGADPEGIQLRYRGATSVQTTEQGALRVQTPAAVFEDAPPVGWVCEEDDSRTPVAVGYVVAQTTTASEPMVGFEVGEYRSDRELVIDPAVFVYCGFIGGGGRDMAYGVAVDSQGCAYVAGWTETSPTFPVKVGPITRLPKVPDAGFVAKVDSTGKNLVYCGRIFGGYYADDTIVGIDVDSAGCAYVVGSTSNNEKTFPVTVGPDLTFNGKMDCFVAKVNAAGTGLDYCGYLGGYDLEYGTGIAVDARGCAYVIGETASKDISHKPKGTPFPTTVGPDTTYNGGGDAFVAKLNPTGTRWLYCGYIGGLSYEFVKGVAVDAKGCAYVVGRTMSTEYSFPVAVGPRLTMWPGAAVDGFVAKVNAKGTGFDYCGYFGGGSSLDELYAVAVDTGGHAYVAGMTVSPAKNLPLTVGPSLKRAGNADALVAKLNPRGTGFVYCGLIGGSGGEGAQAIAVDAQGNAYVAGHTGSTEQTFPVKDAPQMTAQGSVDGWVAMIDSSGRFLRYCGYIAGKYGEYATSIAVTPSGTALVAGWTMSGEMSGFPVTVGPDLTHNMGGKDAFIAKLGFNDVLLSGSGQVGKTVTFTFTASESAGLPYQVASSLGTGPIRIGKRRIGLSPDDLLVLSVSGVWPWIFQGYQGVLGASGRATAFIHIPNVQALVGTRVHTAVVTLDPSAPYGIRSISNTASFSVTK